jgi:hypothetical protein
MAKLYVAEVHVSNYFHGAIRPQHVAFYMQWVSDGYAYLIQVLTRRKETFIFLMKIFSFFS